jgi:hypothetical protein
MLFHPDDRIMNLRKTYTDSAGILTTIKSVMAHPAIESLFHHVHGYKPKLVRSQGGLLQWNFKHSRTPEGNLNAFGVDSGVTGHHADKILADDVITLKDRVSKAAREQTKEFMREVYTNIVDPGKSVAHIGTPWHRDDYWEEGNKICKPMDFPVAKTKLLSAKEIREKRRTTTPFLFSANYDLTIANNEDMLFRDPKYGQWTWMNGQPWAHLDAAFQGDHTCALTIMGRLKDGGIQAIGWKYNGNVKDWLPFIAKQYSKYRVRALLNEDNPDKGYTADKLRDLGLTVHSYSERQNKTLKISSNLYEAWPDILWDRDTDPEYMAQILDWAEGVEPDDAPDSAATLLREKFTTSKKASQHWAMAM